MGYDELRTAIKAAMAEPRTMSVLWGQYSRPFRYVLDLPAEHLADIRLHTGQITGAPYYIGGHDPDMAEASDAEKHRAKAFIRLYERATTGLPERFWLSEPAGCVDFGLSYRGRLVNADVARYQTTIRNLYEAGAIQSGTVVEIGSGYGGLAYHLGRCIKARFVLIDLPEILFFAGCFLLANGRSVSMRPGADYQLVPSHRAHDLAGLDVDLLINTQSFQEMTEAEVCGYVDLFGHARMLYSDNFARHPHNRELTRPVHEILARRFKLWPDPAVYVPFDHVFFRQTYVGGLEPPKADYLISEQYEVQNGNVAPFAIGRRRRLKAWLTNLAPAAGPHRAARSSP